MNPVHNPQPPLHMEHMYMTYMSRLTAGSGTEIDLKKKERKKTEFTPTVPSGSCKK